MTEIRAIVPVKRFAEAKTRLAPLFTAAERAMLAMAMLEDVLAALTASAAVSEVVLATNDPVAQPLAVSFSARIFDAAPVDSLNEAISSALGGTRNTSEAALIVPGDLPLLTPDIVDKAAELTCPHGVVLSPACRDGGTNLIGLCPWDAITPNFGEGSFARHVERARQAGIVPFILDNASLGLDIDTPADIAAFIEHSSSTRTLAFLRKLDVSARLSAPAGSAAPNDARHGALVSQ